MVITEVKYVDNAWQKSYTGINGLACFILERETESEREEKRITRNAQKMAIKIKLNRIERIKKRQRTKSW